MPMYSTFPGSWFKQIHGSGGGMSNACEMIFVIYMSICLRGRPYSCKLMRVHWKVVCGSWHSQSPWGRIISECESWVNSKMRSAKEKSLLCCPTYLSVTDKISYRWREILEIPFFFNFLIFFRFYPKGFCLFGFCYLLSSCWLKLFWNNLVQKYFTSFHQKQKRSWNTRLVVVGMEASLMEAFTYCFLFGGRGLSIYLGQGRIKVVNKMEMIKYDINQKSRVWERYKWLRRRRGKKESI